MRGPISWSCRITPLRRCIPLGRSSNYRLGRKAESKVVKSLRKMGFNAIRVALSKGYYMIHNGDCHYVPGDIAVWVKGGLPVPIEVKKVSYRIKSDNRIRKEILRRMSRKSTSIVVAYHRGNLLYYLYSNNGTKNLVRIDEDRFFDEILMRSRYSGTKSNEGDPVYIIPSHDK